MRHLLASLAVVSLTLSLSACGAKDGAKTDGSSSPASSAEATKPKTVELTPKVAEDRLKAAGFTISSSEPGDDDWQSTYMKVEKGTDDKAVSATIWIDALGTTSSKDGPKPVITMGKDALFRVGWAPAEGKKGAPDLAAIAKDVAKVATPEKATDDFFFGLGKLDEAAKSWKVTEESSRSGGRGAPSGVVYNYRFLSNENGTLVLQDVVFGEAVKKGGTKLVGNTLVAVDASDDKATEKKLYDILLAGS
jgi:hypothetical protein